MEIIEKQQEHFNFRIPLFVKFVKQHPVRKVKVIKVLKEEKRGGAEGAGRPLSYPASIDEELLSWLLIINYLNLPVSMLALQKKAKSLILPHNPCFEDSRGRVRQFKERHNIALRKQSSLCQKLPSQVESKI